MQNPVFEQCFSIILIHSFIQYILIVILNNKTCNENKLVLKLYQEIA